MFSRVRFFMRPILFVKCSHRSDECINHLQYNCLKEHESMRDLKKINCRETYFWLNSNKTNFENKESLNFVRNYANIWRRKNVIFATGPYNYGSFALWKLYHAERYMLICGFYLTELIVLNNNFKGTEEISSNQLALCILCIEGVLCSLTCNLKGGFPPPVKSFIFCRYPETTSGLSKVIMPKLSRSLISNVF